MCAVTFRLFKHYNSSKLKGVGRMGMGIFFSGISGNGITTLNIQVSGNGNGSEVWEWEGMGVPKVIPAHPYCKLMHEITLPCFARYSALTTLR